MYVAEESFQCRLQLFFLLLSVRFVAFMPSHFNVCFNYDVIYYIGEGMGRRDVAGYDGSKG
jgi:hypothetical protein